MKALTLWQPWASLVALGLKTIETRSWSTSYRGPLAIHAAKRKPKVDEALLLLDAGVCRPVDIFMVFAKTDPLIPFGAVIATCELVDVLPVLDGEGPIADGPPRHLTQFGANLNLVEHDGTASASMRNVHDQLLYGDFTPGRFGWLLENIVAVEEPVPATGRQQLWEWSA